MTGLPPSTFGLIADVGVHRVERFIFEAGQTAQRSGSDYGYDLIVWTFDEQGCAEPGAFFMQLKAMETLRERGSYYLFDLDIQHPTAACIFLFLFSIMDGQ